MTIEELKAGLEILIREGATGYCVGAEHDVIYAGHDAPVSKSAKKELKALGWGFDKDLDCWRAFT